MKEFLIVVLCICFFGLGYLVHNYFFMPKVKSPVITTIIKTDTITVKKNNYIKIPFETIKLDTVFAPYHIDPISISLADSLQGLRDSISYKIKHSFGPELIRDSLISKWDVSITSLKKFTFKTVEKEIPVYLNKPFFMEKSFIPAVGCFLLLVLSIIF